MSRLILTTEDLWIELRRALAACMKRQELMYEHYDVVLEIDAASAFLNSIHRSSVVNSKRLIYVKSG